MSGERGTLGGSFQFAARGILETVASQRNMHIHLVAAVLVATFGSTDADVLAANLATKATPCLGHTPLPRLWAQIDDGLAVDDGGGDDLLAEEACGIEALFH